MEERALNKQTPSAGSPFSASAPTAPFFHVPDRRAKIVGNFVATVGYFWAWEEFT
jgi:hypothetical protein